MGKLDGRVAIVTGGASGIGRATAETMVREGARVVIADIDRERADQTAEELGGAGTAVGVHVDVAEEAAVREMVATAVSTFGGLDVIFNNAAALGPDGIGSDGDVTTMDVAVWDRTMAVNVRGVMLGCKYAVPAMLERGGGSIINTSSVSGMIGNPMRIAYGTSKGALIAFTRYVATAYGKQGIRCNNVAPSLVFTPGARANMPADKFDLYLKVHLADRLGEPQDIANTVTFLATDDASFITGQTITVDGGMLVHSPTHPWFDE